MFHEVDVQAELACKRLSSHCPGGFEWLKHGQSAQKIRAVGGDFLVAANTSDALASAYPIVPFDRCD